MKSLSLVALMLAPFVSSAADSKLQPLMAVPDKVVLQDDFSKAGPVKKEHWGARQGTRWTKAVAAPPSLAEHT